MTLVEPVPLAIRDINLSEDSAKELQKISLLILDVLYGTGITRYVLNALKTLLKTTTESVSLSQISARVTIFLELVLRATLDTDWKLVNAK